MRFVTATATLVLDKSTYQVGDRITARVQITGLTPDAPGEQIESPVAIRQVFGNGMVVETEGVSRATLPGTPGQKVSTVSVSANDQPILPGPGDTWSITAEDAGVSRRTMLFSCVVVLSDGQRLTDSEAVEVVKPEPPPIPAPTLPQVPVASSKALREGYGICLHINFGTGVYADIDRAFDLAKASGVYYVRGLMPSPNSARVGIAIAAARRTGVKILATVIPENTNLSLPAEEALLRAKMRRCKQDPDVFIGFEGENEVNANRDDANPDMSFWVPNAVKGSRIIYEEVHGLVPEQAPFPNARSLHLLSPSLHAVQETKAQLQALADAGLLRYVTVNARHRYSGGRPPGYLMEERNQWVQEAWGPSWRSWVTETGGHDFAETTSGHKYAPADVWAVYGPRAVFEFMLEYGCHGLVRYELLDDNDGPDAAPLALAKRHERHFGVYGYAPDGTLPPKPEVGAMSTLMTRLNDPGPSYTPEPVGLRLGHDPADNIRTWVVGKRTGAVTLYAYRNEPVWDPNLKQRLTVPERPLRIEDAGGARTIGIGGTYKAIPIRRTAQ